MREFESDLERIARLSRLLTIALWGGTLVAAGGLSYLLLMWLPEHPAG